MGYTKVHALKTAIHETVDQTKSLLKRRAVATVFLLQILQSETASKSKIRQISHPLKKVYRIEVLIFLAVHLDV